MSVEQEELSKLATTVGGSWRELSNWSKLLVIPTMRSCMEASVEESSFDISIDLI